MSLVSYFVDPLESMSLVLPYPPGGKNLTTNPFKNASRTFFTQSLFYETTLPPRADCLYTLKEEDYLGYPSLRRLFIELEDPTGYLFAEKYLGGWLHLQKLLESRWFSERYVEWEQELEVRMRAKALKKLVAASEDPNFKNYTEINKFLLNRGWKDSKSPRGAPTKAEVKRAAMDLAEMQETVSSDLQRVVEGPLN